MEENDSEIATVRIGETNTAFQKLISVHFHIIIIGDNHHPVEVQLKEIGYAGDEDPTGMCSY